MNNFNMAFVSLMGTEDIGPINGKPAGLTEQDMEMFRQFALDMKFPPNPHRNLDDTLPNQSVTIPGHPVSGNPFLGAQVFQAGNVDADQPCRACHALPFGAAGGKLGGLEPGDDPNLQAGLFSGNLDGSPHSDLKVPHMRNMYEKTWGPRFGSFVTPPDAKNGFGFTHDGSIPDMATFLSFNAFNIDPNQVRNVSVFSLFFPTGTKPAVGRQVTLPGGPPGNPSLPAEQLLTALIGLGNLADPNRHCELVASTHDGTRVRTWYLDGGIGSGGLWTSDVPSAPQVSTTDLRSGATGPVTFLCGPIGSGVRLGADRDLDGALNGGDCSDGDPAASASPVEVANFVASESSPLLSWDDQTPLAGASVYYEVVGGSLDALSTTGLAAATSCVSGPLDAPQFDDPDPDPAPGAGRYYLVRARTAECLGGFGPGRSAIEPLSCLGL
jgi:hypothetical protein